MIYNRTQADVDTALRIRREKVQKFQALTSDDVEALERGTITINTLNRVEQKQAELKNLINGMGYWETPVANKEWGYNDVFDESEFSRIVDNLNWLRNAFFVYKDTPTTPPVSYHYNDINALERILHDLDVMISDVRSHYKRCGETRCGGITND